MAIRVADSGSYTSNSARYTGISARNLGHCRGKHFLQDIPNSTAQLLLHQAHSCPHSLPVLSLMKIQHLNQRPLTLLILFFPFKNTFLYFDAAFVAPRVVTLVKELAKAHHGWTYFTFLSLWDKANEWHPSPPHYLWKDSGPQAGKTSVLETRVDLWVDPYM